MDEEGREEFQQRTSLMREMLHLPAVSKAKATVDLWAIAEFILKRNEQIALEARMEEVSYWKSAIEYPVMDNLHRLSDRMEKRISDLSDKTLINYDELVLCETPTCSVFHTRQGLATLKQAQKGKE